MIRKTWYIDPAKTDSFMEDIADTITEECASTDRMRLNLIFEEAFANVVNHAYPEGSKEKPIWIIFEKFGDSSTYNIKNKIRITIEDYGCEFDTTKYIPTADGTSIGGHGIECIKNYSDFLYYTRINDRINHLEMWINTLS